MRRSVLRVLAILVVVLNAMMASGAAVVCFERGQAAKVEWTLGVDCCDKAARTNAPPALPSIEAAPSDHGCGPCVDVRMAIPAERSLQPTVPPEPLCVSTGEIPGTLVSALEATTCVATSMIEPPQPRLERPFILRS